MTAASPAPRPDGVRPGRSAAGLAEAHEAWIRAQLAELAELPTSAEPVTDDTRQD